MKLVTMTKYFSKQFGLENAVDLLAAAGLMAAIGHTLIKRFEDRTAKRIKHQK